MTPASRRPGPHYITVVTIAVVVVELCCGWCCVVELCCCGCPCVVNGNNYTMVLQIITTPPHCCLLPGPAHHNQENVFLNTINHGIRGHLAILNGKKLLAMGITLPWYWMKKPHFGGWWQWQCNSNDWVQGWPTCEMNKTKRLLYRCGIWDFKKCDIT